MIPKNKNLLKKEKIVSLPVSKFIDTKFRDYAVYVLTSRGIPDFYDALTPVQRYILKNSPLSFQKTLSVVGKAIQSGYHHGNCLSYDTMINLADGSAITIGEWFERYKDAMLLLQSKDENDREVVGVGHSPRVGTETSEYYEIELENGEIIKCTGNHPFYVNGKWIEAKDLSDNDELFNF